MMGHTPRPVELRYFGDNNCVANFTLAVDKRIKKDGQWTKVTTWIGCSVFGKQAEWLQDAPMGALILACGEIYQDEYTDKQGETRKTLRMDCRSAVWVNQPKRGTQDTQPAAPEVDYDQEPPF
jgi:single-strand DNA-binding protein